MISLPSNLIQPTDAELPPAELARLEARSLRSASEEFELVQTVVNDGDSAFDEVFAGVVLATQTPNELVHAELVQPLPAGSKAEPTNEHAPAGNNYLLPSNAEVEQAFAYDDQVEPQARTSVAKSLLPDAQSPTDADLVLNSLVLQQSDETATPQNAEVANQSATDRFGKQSSPLAKNVAPRTSSLATPLVSSLQVSAPAELEQHTHAKHMPAQDSELNFVDGKQAMPKLLGIQTAASGVRPQNPISVPGTDTKKPIEDEVPPAPRTTRVVRVPLPKLAVYETPEALAFIEQSQNVPTDLVDSKSPILDQMGERPGELTTIHLSNPASGLIGSLSTRPSSYSLPIDNGILIANMAREIIDQARIEAGVDETRIELDLDPPELGRVLVRLSETSEGITARIVVAKEHVWQALGESLADFQSTLANAGIDLRDFSLSQQGYEASQEFTGQSTFANRHNNSSPSSPTAPNLTQHLANYLTGSGHVVDVRA